MINRKFLGVILSIAIIASLLFQVVGQAQITTAAPAAVPASAPISPVDESLVPHYFGPYPNYANSPQVVPDAVVEIGGGGGSGAAAVATVDPRTGGIASIDVTSSGSGFIVPPLVTITTQSVVPTVPATAIADISLGVVTGVTVDESGFGFITPTVSFSGGNPALTATAVVSGYVDNLTIVNPGADYVHPVLNISAPDQPGGVQATASAVVGTSGPLSGTIVSVEITNPGAGYSFAPTVTVADAGGLRPSWASGVRRQTAADYKSRNAPTADGQIEATIGVGAINVTSGGQGYSTAPAVTIADTLGTPDKFASATAHVSVLGAVTSISVTNPGAGYLTPGLKKFIDPLPGLCDPAGVVAPVCPTDPAVKAIPVAVNDTTTYSGTDYIEIGLVQYRMKFSSLLPATLLRGYVQLETATNAGVSQHVLLTNANFNPALPDTPILVNGQPVYGVTRPSYLGPTIIASKDRPTRILFRNLLPTGSGGDLFLPVDTTLMGAGPGPDMMQLDPGGVPLEMAMNANSVTDEVRNPICGEPGKPRECFSENRATLHLHGGITPWISDGTPHQWITPAGEDTAYPKGVSVYNVPDMPDPGPGAMTFFYTNQQSARLMFYHDHAWGTTRLNVYAGEAAGYLVTDSAEQALFTGAGAFNDLGLGTPLIVQDKTFVPSAQKIAEQDPTWQTSKWGGEGSLWAPHVYMPAQNPGDPSGMSGFGRWMYGPWFWPPSNAEYQPIPNPYYGKDPATNFTTNLAVPCNLDDPDTWQYQSDPFCEPPLIPGTPNISVGMEAFNDTPLVNGTAYPTTTVDPRAYRFRILNAANDRFFNLSWYVADPRTGTLSEVALNPAELAAAQLDPVVFPTPDETWSPKGPNWIQIGTEGGFLPTPVVIPAHPTTWVTDPTRFDVGLVDQHSLLLAPAERADVIVDFSQFRGKTLILYNDAPAAFPARVPSYDYYTGGPDLSPVGVPTILPGYGPNTRTVMQVRVSMAAPAVAFDRPNRTDDRLGTLMAAFAHHADGSGLFESSVDPIVVGQAAYNSAYGTDFVAGGWCNSLTTPSDRCDGYGRIMEQGGFPFKFDTLNGAQLQIPLQPKGIHDEMNSAHFDEFGRMTANIGLEAPGATPLLQNIILYPYVNPASEILDATSMPSALDVTPIVTGTDGTQIWKITHNGVDTHPIHFHLFNVQVLNRVAWDNNVQPPDPNELGWKETVRINPLQDTYVVMRPIVPSMPFAVPDSYRPLNPMMPIGARGNQNGSLGIQAGFNNTDANGNPIAPIVNELVNFGWEYVWHCHILSHEEMDMMRPMSVIAPSAVPLTPTLVSLVASAPISVTPQVRITWTDPTPVTSTATLGNLRNEIGFRIERATGTSASAPFLVVATAPANSTVYTDTTVGSLTTYRYRVAAFNVSGSATSNVRSVLTPSGAKPAAPTALTALQQALSGIRLTWTDNATNETGFVVERGVNGGAFSPLTTVPRRTGVGSVTYNNNITVTVGNSYAYVVRAVNGIWSSGSSNVATVDMLPMAPTSLQSTAQSSTAVTLTWQQNQPAVADLGYDIWVGRPPAVVGGPVTWSQAAQVGDVGSYAVTGLTSDSTYYWQVRAFVLNETKYYFSGWSNVITANTTP